MARKRAQVKGRGAAGSGPGKAFYLGLGLVALVGVGALVLARSSGSEPITRPLSVAELSAGADPSVGVTMGPEEAPLTIMEFTDFQCPVCKQFNALTGRLLRQNYAGPSGPVRWIAYDFPLDQHANAVPAALAARCGEAQGRFWQMHDLLLARQENWATDRSPAGRFSDYAKELGLDVGEFDRCLTERQHISEVVASMRYGEQLGVRGTPTVFLNGEPLENRSYRYIEQRIQEAVGGGAGRGE
ncbi:MAG: DsbA family protein [Gemmatimonadota bacterium]